MKMFVLAIIRGSDLGEKPGNHFDDVLDLHATDLILRALAADGVSAGA
jgi:hypothetical protein